MPEVRPKLARISEAMQEWSALLGAELASWPSVKARRMFGMTAFYRGQAIFAALPRTRAMGSSHSVAFKLCRQNPRIQRMLRADPRIYDPGRPDAKWITLELESESDLARALKWFDLAYRNCGRK